ncbi:MAG: LapA family protein [Gemmataceae bacterium]|nr:LapA family protein [Gemmataceae bacterium]
MNYATGILAVVLLAVVGVFSFQNREAVDVTFLLWSMSVPKVLLILSTYLLGMLSGWGLIALVKQAAR